MKTRTVRISAFALVISMFAWMLVNATSSELLYRSEFSTPEVRAVDNRYGLDPKVRVVERRVPRIAWVGTPQSGDEFRWQLIEPRVGDSNLALFAIISTTDFGLTAFRLTTTDPHLRFGYPDDPSDPDAERRAVETLRTRVSAARAHIEACASRGDVTLPVSLRTCLSRILTCDTALPRRAHAIHASLLWTSQRARRSSSTSAT